MFIKDWKKDFFTIPNMLSLFRLLLIPVYIIIMIFFNSIGIVGITVLAALLLIELICLAKSKTVSLLHDVLGCTVAVDMASQMIFNSREELLAYVTKVHSERAAHSDY